MAVELNDLAFQNADILEALDASPNGQLTMNGLARQIGRDVANMRKSVQKLVAQGILQSAPLDGLTPAGEVQLAAIRRAKGEVGGDSDSGQGEYPRWPADRIKPNPANRKVDPATIPDMADSIVGAEDVVQPINLSPVDADGDRMLIAGERRWRGTLLCTEQGRLPPALEAGLPFVERDVPLVQQLIIMSIENEQRENPSPWEDAKLLAKIADEVGGNASEVARRTGRMKEVDGKRGGLRDVQWKIKTAKEAPPEAVAIYEADPDAPGAWERLRDSVRKASGPATPFLALFIVETALRAESEGGVWDHPIAIEPNMQFPIGWEVWFDYAHETGAVTLTTKAADWLTDEGLGDDMADSILVRYRAKCGRPHHTAREPWVTDVLNWRPGDEDDPLVVAGVRYPNATRAAEARRIASGERYNTGGGSPSQPAQPTAADSPSAEPGLPIRHEDERARLTEKQTCALLELAHKIGAKGFDLNETQRAATVGAFWLSPLANDLVFNRMARFVQVAGGKPPVGVLTERGAAHLVSGGWTRNDKPFVTDEDLRTVQIAAYGAASWPDAYATDWIETEVAPPASLPDAPTADGQTDLEDAAQAAADTEADATLARVQALVARGRPGPMDRWEIARLLDDCQAFGPLKPDQDAVVLNARDELLFSYDQAGDLPNGLAQAGALLISHLVNSAVADVDAQVPNPWPEPAPDGEQLLARIVRTGAAMLAVMVANYDALNPDPATSETYRQFSDAHRALQSLLASTPSEYEAIVQGVDGPPAPDSASDAEAA